MSGSIRPIDRLSRRQLALETPLARERVAQQLAQFAAIAPVATKSAEPAGLKQVGAALAPQGPRPKTMAARAKLFAQYMESDVVANALTLDDPITKITVAAYGMMSDLTFAAGEKRVEELLRGVVVPGSSPARTISLETVLASNRQRQTSYGGTVNQMAARLMLAPASMNALTILTHLEEARSQVQGATSISLTWSQLNDFAVASVLSGGAAKANIKSFADVLHALTNAQPKSIVDDRGQRVQVSQGILFSNLKQNPAVAAQFVKAVMDKLDATKIKQVGQRNVQALFAMDALTQVAVIKQSEVDSAAQAYVDRVVAADRVLSKISSMSKGAPYAETLRWVVYSKRPVDDAGELFEQYRKHAHAQGNSQGQEVAQRSMFFGGPETQAVANKRKKLAAEQTKLAQTQKQLEQAQQARDRAQVRKLKTDERALERKIKTVEKQLQTAIKSEIQAAIKANDKAFSELDGAVDGGRPNKPERNALAADLVRVTVAGRAAHLRVTQVLFGDLAVVPDPQDVVVTQPPRSGR